MRRDLRIEGKHVAQIGDSRVAYYDEGTGPAVLFLHGCPFASFVWRKIIPLLAPRLRCVAPDLLGLGDTETSAMADWSLLAQAAAMVRLLDFLGLERAHVVGHDHGGAVGQLLAANYPDRVGRLVLANVEAYDNWPSAEESAVRTADADSDPRRSGALGLVAEIGTALHPCSCAGGLRRSRAHAGVPRRAHPRQSGRSPPQGQDEALSRAAVRPSQ